MTQLIESPFFGITLSIFAYWLGDLIHRKTQSALCNAMVISVVFIIVFLKTFGISYDNYAIGADTIYMLLGPATACFGISVYNKLSVLKENLIPVIVGCVVGTVTSVVSVALLCKFYNLSHELTMSLLPKSVTNAIAAPIVEANGGNVAFAVAAISVTGVGGNLLAPYFAKLFRVKDPVAEGIAIGTSSHGMGTARALKIGDTQGAMSGLAMALCGVCTAFIALSFPYFYG